MGHRQLENERPTPKQQRTHAPLPHHAHRRTRPNRPRRPDRLPVATAQRHADCPQQPHPHLRPRRQPLSQQRCLHRRSFRRNARRHRHRHRPHRTLRTKPLFRREKRNPTPQNGKRPQRRPHSPIVRRRKPRRTRSRQRTRSHRPPTLRIAWTEHQKHRRRLRAGMGNRHRQSRHRRTNCRHARIHLQRNLVFVRKRC